MRFIIYAALMCLPVIAEVGYAQAIQPANVNASQNARQVLSYLYNLPGQPENRLISGHLAGGSVRPKLTDDYTFKMDEIEYLREVSGQWIGMIGADYCAGWIETSDPIGDTMNYTDLNRGLIDYWNAGGLVIITTHQFDPRELYNDGGQSTTKMLPEGVEPIDISRLYTAGTVENRNFRVIMDVWAAGLQELAEHGVVVIWRPFNEITNSRKWWCRKPAEQFKALYRYTFNYMTHEKGLNNLLWTYDAKPANVRALGMSHYPGDDFVDIVGYTMNWDEGEALQPEHPVPNKVFGCVEFNIPTQMKANTIQRDYDYAAKFAWMKEHIPYASFFMSWDRVWGPYGRGIPASVRAMYNDPVVMNRDEINWREGDQ
jgi:beta-mannanase